MAAIFSVPQYIPDPTSTEVVVGYDVQACAPTAGLPVFTGTWVTVTGSPFASNSNIVDPTGTNATQYRVRPVRQVTVGASTYTLDTPYSRAFTPDTPLYDSIFTRVLLPNFRASYIGDVGAGQTNGTTLGDTSGAGNGVWIPDGSTKRFPLQYVMNDDPIKVMDNLFQMTRTVAGTQVSMQPDVDYAVDPWNAVVTFATAPAATDYIRFDFRRCDVLNETILQTLTHSVNALSQFGINGYQLNKENNLYFLNQPLGTPDLGEILCKVAGYVVRVGGTEAALRSSYAWRDGGINVDPYPSRALEFLVAQQDTSEMAIRRACNTYIRGVTKPRVRGDLDMMFDMTQQTPQTLSMFAQFAGYYGLGASVGGAGFMGTAWWI